MPESALSSTACQPCNATSFSVEGDARVQVNLGEMAFDGGFGDEHKLIAVIGDEVRETSMV